MISTTTDTERITRWGPISSSDPREAGRAPLIAKKIADRVSAGRRVILIVPEQSAVSAEAMVCSEAQSRGIPQTELEILNFRRLCNRVFRQYGGVAYNAVTPGAKALIMWQAVFLVPLLRLNGTGTGLPMPKNSFRCCFRRFSEFKAYGITPSPVLSDAAKEAEEDDKALSEKLSDLSLICSAYSHFAERGFSDPFRRSDKAG